MRGLVILLVLCGGCSDDGDPEGGRGGVSDGSSDRGSAGESGGAADEPSASKFGNSGEPTIFTNTMPVDVADRVGDELEFCSPGVYRGSYVCDLIGADGSSAGELVGDVQFDLAIDETAMKADCDPGQEFCFDLVIPEGSGTLFGFVLLFLGFETQLEGGLDCRTGEFRATAIDGVWGLPTSSDPNDPNAPATVSDPPLGTFMGSLAGTHPGTDPQKIEGTWDLTEIENGYNCNGPFTVELIP